MMPNSSRATALALLLMAWAPMAPRAGDDPPRTGPGSEKRFPPLKVPPGFKATLFACDPMVEYPSAIAAGPRAGALFVAIDYLSGLGAEIVRRDEVRLVEDIDGDGYADKASVYAAGFNSIQGLAFHDGTLFVMHAPFLTAVRDRDGDGVAEDRRDLLTGLGLPPEKNPSRLHCANGVVAGHDGWLYLALGDNGCDVPRPGRRSAGAPRRRHPALPAGRARPACLRHRPAEHLRRRPGRGAERLRARQRERRRRLPDPRLPQLLRRRPRLSVPLRRAPRRGPAAAGRSSAAAPPRAGSATWRRGSRAEYRGNLFFCEWGRAVVRYRPARSGSGFAPLKQIEFAAGGDGDPYGFKPTDLVVQRDGSLIVADWADGQQPKRGRGRIYRITASGPLGSRRRVWRGTGSRAKSPGSTRTSYAERCRRPGSHSNSRGAEALDRRARRDPTGPHRRAGAAACRVDPGPPGRAGRDR